MGWKKEGQPRRMCASLAVPSPFSLSRSTKLSKKKIPWLWFVMADACKWYVVPSERVRMV